MRTTFRKILLPALFLVGMKVPSTAAQTPAAARPFVHPAYSTGASSPMGEQIVTLLSDPAVSRAHWGIAVTALDGTPIWGLDEGKLFRPASNAKLYTTAAAMALLGPDSTVTTTVTAAALPDANGTIAGDIVLNGAGDANLSGVRFPYETPQQQRARGVTPSPSDPLAVMDDLAAQVAAKGVKHLTGEVIGSDAIWPTDPYPIGWDIDDMVWGYGAPVSALVVNDNEIQLKLTPSEDGGGIAVDVSPRVQYTSKAEQVIDAVTGSAKSATHIMIDRADLNDDLLHIEGSIAQGKPDLETIAVLHPAEYAAAALRDRLAVHGIGSALDLESKARTLESDSTESFLATTRRPIDLSSAKHVAPSNSACKVEETCVILASHKSPTLAQDLLYTMKESQNLLAEVMSRRLGMAFGDEGTTAQGARVVRQFLLNAGLDGDDFLFYDGSGLSSHDLVTPRTTAQLLSFATTQPWFATWKASMPIGGVDGTLSSRFKDAPLKGHVYAKTGTLGESRGLSGYLDCASGRQVIFSIFVDGHTPIGSADRSVMDKIVAAIAANN